MKKIIYFLFGCLALNTLYSCKKNNQTDYKDFLNGHEIVYTGVVAGVSVQPGYLKMGLKWKISTDPNITSYVIYYNNGADSQIVDLAPLKTDTVSIVINGLKESTYSFTIYSKDSKGNKSLPVIVNNAKVYGPAYTAGLVNRAYNATNPFTINADKSVTLNFERADSTNLRTIIAYTSLSGAPSLKVLSPDSSSITLDDLQDNTEITYRSYYLPEKNALDVSIVANDSKFPAIFVLFSKCDKSLFHEITLPNDVSSSPGQGMEHLWDETVGPQAPPAVFFNDGGSTNNNPNHFTFDLGKVYKNLSIIEETGTVIGSLNPTEFEVWGITYLPDLSDALPANDPGWAQQSKDKGWVLLGHCKRTDDGSGPMKFDLMPDAPEVRFVRIRIIKSNLADNVFGLSELTFWTKNK